MAYCFYFIHDMHVGATRIPNSEQNAQSAQVISIGHFLGTKRADLGREGPVRHFLHKTLVLGT